MNRSHYILHIDRLLLEGMDLSPSQAEQLRQELSLALRTRLVESGVMPTRAAMERVTLPPLSQSEVGQVSRLASSLSERIAGMLSGTQQEAKHV